MLYLNNSIVNVKIRKNKQKGDRVELTVFC